VSALGYALECLRDHCLCPQHPVERRSVDSFGCDGNVLQPTVSHPQRTRQRRRIEKGGDGVASFRREKFVPRGGPDGGDGGRGGTIYAVADRNINTLIDYRYARIHRAKNGEKGQGSDCYGRSAPDITLRVPVGTVVADFESGEVLTDLAKDGSRAVLARGGKGGLGNLHFKSSTNRAPRQFTPGGQGEQRRLRLELKVLADVGLLGLPNAGKSTFIRAVSAARPKVADYPFTTLAPNLGVVRTDTSRSFVIADIPGLIAGAADGAGLGHQFLRHLQRTRLLLHLVDAAGDDPVEAWRVVRAELETYGEGLEDKPEVIALSRADLVDEERLRELKAEIADVTGTTPFPISAPLGEGLEPLLDAIIQRLGPSDEPLEEVAEGDRPWSPL